MSAATTRLNLTKPGGGSTGLITPPDPVDIDVINANMDKIDASVGAPTYTSVTRPASPYDGQIIRESDTQRLAVYRQATTSWNYDGIYDTVGRGSRTMYYAADLGALDAISTALDGDICIVENPGTGVTQDLAFKAIAGTGATIDWRVEDMVVSDTLTNLTAFIGAVGALVGTDVQFKVGEFAFAGDTATVYRFTSTAGVMIPVTANGIISRSYDSVSVGATANGVVIKTIAIPAYPYATVLEFEYLGTIGNGTGADLSGKVVPSVSAGVLTLGGNTNQVRAHAGFYAAFGVVGQVAIPASTALNLVFTTATGGNMIHDAGIRLLRTVS